jgi:CheY-like chemotaxis protein
MKLRVCIIDDYQTEIERAQETLESITYKKSIEIETRPTTEFHWPLDTKERPDLVILDLENDNDPNIDGIHVYQLIREEERQLRRNGGSFNNSIDAECYILLWSAFRGSPKATDFFDAMSFKDNKLILCEVKSKVILKKMMASCIDRIEEENTSFDC